MATRSRCRCEDNPHRHPSPSTDRPYRLEQIDDAAVVQLYADGFADLSFDEKILVWHLYLAARAGRDIYYDQRYPHNLAMRDILEEIITHREGIPALVVAELTRYTKLFWINTGPYNNLTARKFVLNLSREQLVEAAEIAARDGARFRLTGGESLSEHIARYAPMFFDPAVDPMVTCKTPGGGRDILESSANNLYRGVTMVDLASFKERYPLNSRVVKRDGAIVEEVYRVGGRYDAEIRKIVGHLERAAAVAPPSLAVALRALIRWYQLGEEADREAFDIAWVQNRDSAVDTMNGFIEVYMDARGTKGAWEGVVYYVNHGKTDKIHRLAEHAQWFEDHLPIEPALSQTTRPGHLGPRYRSRVRSWRFRPGHADWREPAQRSTHSRGVRQQVGLARERDRSLRTVHARQLPP